MGWVFEARDLQRAQSIALKILRAPRPDNEFRLKREFRALADVRHPNLVRMHELGREGGTFFVTMELVEGVDFATYVRPHPEWRLDGDRLRSALAQLIRGVQALHAAGTLHRDLKPWNVLVDRSGRVVVLDFGVIHEASPLWFAPLRESAGTPGFMAPEQARGLPAVAASDWYSVGAMLYSVLAGELLPGVPRAPRLDAARAALALAGAPEDLTNLTLALLDAVPERRPDGAAIAAALGLPRFDPAPRLRTLEGLVGRTRELARLHELLARAQSDVPVRVLIRGPAGIGKTALVRAFLEQAVRDGALALAGKCHERDTVPYKALDTIVDELSRYLECLRAAELAELITPDVSALLQMFPALGQIPQLRACARMDERVWEPIELRRRALSALRELLRRIGQRRPVVLFIDDLQWGDPDSAELLMRLIEPPDAPRLLLITAYRDAAGTPGPALESPQQAGGPSGALAPAEQLVVPALTHEQASEMLARLLAAVDVSDLTCRQLASESAGNPLFAIEIARSWLDSHAEIAAGGEPPSLAALLRRRIARLPAAAGELLALTVVASRPLTIDVLREALSSGPATLWPSIDLLKLERFVQGQTAGAAESIALCHDRIRETVDATLDDARRVRLHAQLADAIRAVAPDEHDQLLDHLLGAGLTTAAGECAVRAGDGASSVLAFDGAAHFYRKAIDLLAAPRSHELGLYRKLADMLAAAARCGEAAAVYLELSARAAGEQERTELLRRAAVHALAGGARDASVAAFAALFDALGLPWRTSERAAMTEPAALACALLDGEPTVRAHTCVMHAGLHWMRGGFAEAEALGASAEELTRTLPAARITHLIARQFCVSCQLWQGKLQAADRGLERILTDAGEHGPERRSHDHAEPPPRLDTRSSLASEPLLRHAPCIITPGAGWRWESWFDLLAALYSGDLARASELEELLRLDPVWSRLGNLQQLYATGLVTLTQAATEAMVDPELRDTAEHAAGSLEGLKLAPADACAAMVRAGLAALDGEAAKVRACLAAAADGFFACGMPLFGHCARRAFGLASADVRGEGQAWMDEANAFMRRQGVVDCDRWTRCHVPAFERMRRLAS